MNDKLKIKLEGPQGTRGKPVREIKSKKTGNFERRIYVKRGEKKEDTEIFMIDWKNSEISHLHCKKCNNEWQDRWANSINEYFIVEENENETILTCKCGSKLVIG